MNNSEYRTSNFSTVGTGIVHLVVFLADYERFPTRITTIFGQMRKNLYSNIEIQSILKLLRQCRDTESVYRTSDQSIRVPINTKKTRETKKSIMKIVLKKGVFPT